MTYEYMNKDMWPVLRELTQGRDYEGVTTVPTAVLYEAAQQIEDLKEEVQNLHEAAAGADI